MGLSPSLCSPGAVAIYTDDVSTSHSPKGSYSIHRQPPMFPIYATKGFWCSVKVSAALLPVKPSQVLWSAFPCSPLSDLFPPTSTKYHAFLEKSLSFPLPTSAQEPLEFSSKQEYFRAKADVSEKEKKIPSSPGVTPTLFLIRKKKERLARIKRVIPAQEKGLRERARIELLSNQPDVGCRMHWFIQPCPSHWWNHCGFWSTSPAPSRAPDGPAAAGAGGRHVSFKSSASPRTAHSPPLIHGLLHLETNPIHPGVLLGSHRQRPRWCQ